MKKCSILIGLICFLVFSSQQGFAIPISGSGDLGSFEGSWEYDGTDTLTVTLTNTSDPGNGGYITAFAFNNPLEGSGDSITNVTLSDGGNFGVIGGDTFLNDINGQSLGWFDIGAALADQLSVEATDGGSTVSFEFENDVGLASSITDVYFDDTLGLFNDLILIEESAGVAYSEFADPSNLPGGASIGFFADFSADSDSPVLANGVNTTDEWVRITFDYTSTNDFGDVLAAIGSGDLRIGIKLQGTGVNAQFSDTFVNVPEPTTMLLLGSGLVGLALYGRKRSRKEAGKAG